MNHSRAMVVEFLMEFRISFDNQYKHETPSESIRENEWTE